MELPAPCASSLSLRRLSMNLLWLGDPKSFDVALVAGKAAHLSRLARMDHRVPDGFCLPVTLMDVANPITGSRDEIMINASWGLGESIVGGTVTPDTFIVRTSDLVITSRTIADKQRMTVSVPGGTCEVDVPRFLRTQVALNDAQAME